MNPLCPNCKDILEQVTISSERDNHVIQMHYSSERVQNKSTFTNNIQLHFFFQEVVEKLRSGVLEKATHRRRLNYFYKFDFIVGNFPNWQSAQLGSAQITVVVDFYPKG